MKVSLVTPSWKLCQMKPKIILLEVFNSHTLEYPGNICKLYNVLKAKHYITCYMSHVNFL